MAFMAEPEIFLSVVSNAAGVGVGAPLPATTAALRPRVGKSGLVL